MAAEKKCEELSTVWRNLKYENGEMIMKMKRKSIQREMKAIVSINQL